MPKELNRKKNMKTDKWSSVGWTNWMNWFSRLSPKLCCLSVVLGLVCVALSVGGCATHRAKYNVQIVGGSLFVTGVEAALHKQTSMNRHLVGFAVIPPAKDTPDPRMILIFEEK